MYYIYGISGPSLLIESTDSMILVIYNEKYFSDDHFSYIVRVITYVPGCYERAARAERSPHYIQGSGLVRTVGPCAQRRVALLPRAIEMHC